MDIYYERVCSSEWDLTTTTFYWLYKQGDGFLLAAQEQLLSTRVMASCMGLTFLLPVGCSCVEMTQILHVKHLVLNAQHKVHT